jgi:transposase-like protein
MLQDIAFGHTFDGQGKNFSRAVFTPCSGNYWNGFSSISRLKGIAWNTVAHWLEKASESCRRLNDRRTAGFCMDLCRD